METNEHSNTRRRIDEISMLKGVGIIFVILYHLSLIAGLSDENETFYNVLTSLSTPSMMVFFFIGGYTTSTRQPSAARSLADRMHRILVPYYLYSIPMIIIYAVIYPVIERKNAGWFADGVCGILFQLQSFHFFDTSVSGVHPMFYGVIVGWFLFQMAVSTAVFIPILYLLKDRKSIYKLLTAIILFAVGAVLYILNLQGLNGLFFPPVCKIFILPNIPGIAGVLLVGSWLRDHSVYDFDMYPAWKKAATLAVCLVLIVVFVVTDDYWYDFPIGKWGAYGVFSYITAPVYGLAVTLFIGIICNLVKRFSPVRKLLIHMGDHSMDYLMMHFFLGFLTAYVCGFWVNYLTDTVPDLPLATEFMHYAVLLAAVFVLSAAVIALKKRFSAKGA